MIIKISLLSTNSKLSKIEEKWLISHQIFNYFTLNLSAKPLNISLFTWTTHFNLTNLLVFTKIINIIGTQ